MADYQLTSEEDFYLFSRKALGFNEDYILNINSLRSAIVKLEASGQFRTEDRERLDDISR